MLYLPDNTFYKRGFFFRNPYNVPSFIPSFFLLFSEIISRFSEITNCEITASGAIIKKKSDVTIRDYIHN